MYKDLFFFCKQKTAYEMRISDWSSDVCSSDLLQRLIDLETVFALRGPWPDRGVERHAIQRDVVRIFDEVASGFRRRGIAGLGNAADHRQAAVVLHRVDRKCVV